MLIKTTKITVLMQLAVLVSLISLVVASPLLTIDENEQLGHHPFKDFSPNAKRVSPLRDDKTQLFLDSLQSSHSAQPPTPAPAPAPAPARTAAGATTDRASFFSKWKMPQSRNAVLATIEEMQKALKNRPAELSSDYPLTLWPVKVRDFSEKNFIPAIKLPENGWAAQAFEQMKHQTYGRPFYAVFGKGNVYHVSNYGTTKIDGALSDNIKNEISVSKPTVTVPNYARYKSGLSWMERFKLPSDFRARYSPAVVANGFGQRIAGIGARAKSGLSQLGSLGGSSRQWLGKATENFRFFPRPL
ncbi:uncharacterized protein MEPE_03953 [Melanopsichium pennsylvanicum]|uniref:Uncharacterized protein n=2 Tax=Melanopsichium pennsylvanicum TaxID=63383 RepID=A0AAJ5C672_9BASI|nr:uncharacterized protein BN887_00271 [Melanopsichium pennsylvanicum 4]SNX85244.1 uncharacterized protein MEPE_03953 [Melanopsichium pennsylvanicum]